MPRRRAVGKGKVAQQAVNPQTLNLLFPSRPPKGNRDPNPIAFKEVTIPKLKRGGELEEQMGRDVRSLRDGGRREEG